MKKYYIHNDAEALGPYTVEELADMEITKYTPVWCEGLPGWTPAMQVRELKSLWSDNQPFVYNAGPPPKFEKHTYEQALKENTQPLIKPKQRERSLGSPVFWVGVIAMVTTVVVALSFNYHQRTVNETYMNALDQRRWEDSLDREMGAAAVAEAEPDTAMVSVVGNASDAEFERAREAYAKNYTRMNIERYVRVAKTFDVKRLGGIKDAKVAVYNNSDFPIDRAEVEVVYVKANGEVFKSQTISVNNIPAHGRREANVPDEKRGTDLRCTLKKISAAELGVSKNVSISF